LERLFELRERLLRGRRELRELLEPMQPAGQ
jgi:hypothetical protein